MFLSLTMIQYILIGLGVVLISFLLLVYRLSYRMKKLLVGKKAINIEDSIVNLNTSVLELKKFTKEMRDYLTTVEKRLKQSIQSVETVRYNPFKGMGAGGNISFSTSFVNEHGNGVVLTSMYARDRISMFAKPLKAFKSEFELSEEETEAIDHSKKGLGS